MNKHGRRPKKPEDCRTSVLQVPVTAEQKTRLYNTAINAGQDFAAWARQVMFAAMKEAESESK